MLQHRINIVIDQNNELLEKSRLKKKILSITLLIINFSRTGNKL